MWRIRPSGVICYGQPFEEMRGRVIGVDYAAANHLSPHKSSQPGSCYKQFIGKIVKGKGSAFEGTQESLPVSRQPGFSVPDEGVSGAGFEALETETINKTVGEKITGYTKHGLNQAIGRDGGKGVSPEAILDTIRNPKDIITQSSQYGPTYKYVSDKAVVVLNEEGKVVTTYAKGSQWTRGGN